MKRIILAISVMLVLGLAVAAIAFSRSSVSVVEASCCAHGSDSCPMKKDGSGKEAVSCCDDCCKGDSCPMKKGSDASAHGSHSCPMMKGKDGHASHAAMTEAEHEAMKADGTSCCSCCGAKQDA